MARNITFEARVEAGGPGKAWFHADFPKKVTDFLGTKASVRVRGTINGFAFRSSALPNGDGTHHLMVNKAMRDGAKVADGDRARFTLTPDTKPRIVRAPPELRKALAGNATAAANFRKLAPSHRKAYVDYVVEAKKPETRARRAQQSVAKLAKGDGRWED